MIRTDITTFRALLDLWPQPDIGGWLSPVAEDLGVSVVHARRAMRMRTISTPCASIRP
jgi:hypothetical protein